MNAGHRRVCLPLVGGVALVCLGHIDVLGEEILNRSERREAEGMVISAYPEMRRSVAGIPGGCAASGTELVVLAWTRPVRYDLDSVADLGTDGRERRSSGALVVRNPLAFGAGFGFQLGGELVHRDSDIDSDLAVADPWVDLSYQAVNERRVGLRFHAGVTLPMGDESDWISAHGGWGYRVGAAASFQPITLLGISMVAEGLWVPSGENDASDGRTWDTETLQGRMGAVVTWRVDRMLRIGVAQYLEHTSWEGDADGLQLDSRVTSAPTMGIAEISFSKRFHLSCGLGGDFMSTSRGEGISALVGLSFLP